MAGSRDDVRDFLTTRRAKITPERAGLPVYGGHRRVAGLRREEVALLAGISVEYYTRLERGGAGSVSDAVLEGLVHALQLDEAERDHLYRLLRSQRPRTAARRGPASQRVRPTLRRLLDQMPMPAYVRNARFDILAGNELGRALYAPVFDQADRGALPNTARFVFLDATAGDFFRDFETVAGDCVAYLRAEAGRDPYDKPLSELVGELSTRSVDFRERWAAHDVRYHRTGRKHLVHPVVGPLELDFEAMDLAGDRGQRLNVYTAEPGSASAEALSLLASWVSTEVAGRR